MMAFPDLLQAEDYEGIRSLLGVTERDVDNALIDQVPYGPQGEGWVTERVTDWADYQPGGAAPDPAKALLLRIAASYATAALIAETFVRGGVIGLVYRSGQPDRNWNELAGQLWGRASQVVGEMLAEGTVPVVPYDLVGIRIGGPSRTYYRPLYGREWWKYPPVVGYSFPPTYPPED